MHYFHLAMEEFFSSELGIDYADILHKQEPFSSHGSPRERLPEETAVWGSDQHGGQGDQHWTDLHRLGL